MEVFYVPCGIFISLPFLIWSFIRGNVFGCNLAGIEDGYSGADYINPQGYELSSESRAQADLKFTYVVSCQIYGQQKQKKAAEAADIALLMQRLFALIKFMVSMYL